MIKHVERMRMNRVDTDASGIIHYTAAFRFFEFAEEALLRKLFPEGLPDDTIWRLPRVHAEADYKAPLRFPDEFDCAAWVMAVGNSSLTYGYEIHRADGVLCIRGKVVVATFDGAGQSVPVPPGLRAGLLRAL